MRVIVCLTTFLVFWATQVLALDYSGTTSGVFINPVGPSGMVTTGAGSSFFTWGAGYGTPPSHLLFTGTAFSGNFGTEFKFGTLSYYNGTIVSDSGADSVDLKTILAFTNPAATTQNFTFNFNLINTPNVGDDVTNADYVMLTNTFDPSSTFSYGGVDYYLRFTRFEAIDSFGFSTDATQFHVYENAMGSANLYARLTPNPVPEPGTMVLFGAGMLGFVALSKRNRSRKA